MNVPSIIEEAYKALKSLCNWGRRHAQPLLNAVALVTALAVVWQLWFSYGERQLVMFVGAPGSSTAAIGRELVKEISRTRDSRGVNYKIALEPTPENLSIRDRMTYEANRIPLGIVDDGQMQGDNLRALLPLEWDYLYVLCSHTLLKETADARSAATDETATKPGAPTNEQTVKPAGTGDGGQAAVVKSDSAKVDERDVLTLADVIAYVTSNENKHKVFLGPSNTSSYKMARFTLRKFGGISDAHLATGIADWDAARVALQTGDLGLVFYSGPLGTDFIDDVASDKMAVLLDLGDITDAIQHSTGFQVYAATLPANLGAAKVHDKTSTTPDLDTPVAFCRDKLKTIACRRVLACPRSLPTSDAYLLASAALAVLVDQEYYVNLNADDPPHNDPAATIKTHLLMPSHPAMKLLQEGTEPIVWRQWNTWPVWLKTVVLILLGLFAIDLLRLLTTRLESVKSAGNDRIEKRLVEYETEIDNQTHHEIAKDLAAWDVKLRDLRKEIHAAADITPSQRESFLRRYRALEFEIESSPRWVHKAALVTEPTEPGAQVNASATPGAPAG